jgi:hypothetical protein
VTGRAVILLLGLWLAGPLVGAASSALAQDIPEPHGVCVACGHDFESHGSSVDCSCCNPGGGGGGGGGEEYAGPSGDAPLFVLLADVVVAPFFFAAGLGFGFAWMFQRLTGSTDLFVFEYVEAEAGSEDAGVFGSGAVLLGGVVALTLYLPVLGVTELVGAVVDDDGEASARVSERAAEVRAEHAAAQAAFAAAHPPPAPAAPLTAGALAALDVAAARRARVEEALAATNDVTAAPPPAAPAWPTAASIDPTTQTVAPLSRQARPAFVVPPPPPSTDEADRAAGVLERARGLLREGVAEAREKVVEEVKDGALGLLPDRVERALRANLAAQEGTLSTLERVRDEGVPLLAFGTADQVGALERDLERGRVETAEAVLDEAQGDDGDDGWLDFVRRGLRAEREE